MLTSSRNSSNKITIGRVTSAHGLAGELNVIPLTDFPERFEAMESVELYKQGRFFKRLEVLDVRFRTTSSRGDIITLMTNLEDRNEAEECVGSEILIEPEDRVELPPGNFWVDDLIGLQVEDTEGNVLGTVTELLSAGANELYEVRDPEGKLHYIPAVQEFVRDIDLQKGRICVALIEGLW